MQGGLLPRATTEPQPAQNGASPRAYVTRVPQERYGVGPRDLRHGLFDIPSVYVQVVWREGSFCSPFPSWPSSAGVCGQSGLSTRFFWFPAPLGRRKFAALSAMGLTVKAACATMHMCVNTPPSFKHMCPLMYYSLGGCVCTDAHVGGQAPVTHLASVSHAWLHL